MSDQGISLPEDLYNAEVKLQFGKTVFGLLTVNGQEVVAGYREYSEPKVWWGMATFGPELIANIRDLHEIQTLLETVLLGDLVNHPEEKIHAVVLGVDGAFLAFAEGLIVRNEVRDLNNGFYEGQIILLGRIWRLLLQDRISILDTEHSAATVDMDLNILP